MYKGNYNLIFFKLIWKNIKYRYKHHNRIGNIIFSNTYIVRFFCLVQLQSHCCNACDWKSDIRQWINKNLIRIYILNIRFHVYTRISDYVYNYIYFDILYCEEEKRHHNFLYQTLLNMSKLQNILFQRVSVDGGYSRNSCYLKRDRK